MVSPLEAETIRILDQETGFNFNQYLSLEELRERELQEEVEEEE